MLTVDFAKFRPVSGDLVLDAGCGEGRHTFALARRGCRVLGLDMDLTSVQKALFVMRALTHQGEQTGPVCFMRGDALSLPFAEATFDKVICSEVMEHIHADGEVAAEFFRVLKPGGVMAVTVPTPITEHVYGRLSREYFRTPGGHIRIYKPREIFRVLTNAGFSIYALSFAHSFHAPYWVLRCLCGLHDETARPPKLYHKFLHLVVGSRRLSWFEKTTDFLFPKSMVVYVQKPL